MGSRESVYQCNYPLFSLPLGNTDYNLLLSESVNSKNYLFFKKAPILVFPSTIIRKSIEWYGNCISFKYYGKKEQLIGVKLALTPKACIINSHNLADIKSRILSENISQFQLNHFEEYPLIIFSTVLTEKSNPKKSYLYQFTQIWKKATTWFKKLPKTSNFVDNEIWKINWIINRIQNFKLKKELIMEYFTPKYRISTKESTSISTDYSLPPQLTENSTLWDNLNLVDDFMWYSPEQSSKILESIKDFYHVKSGRISNLKNHEEIGAPPIWSFLLLELSKFTGDFRLIHELYPILQRNIKWWEENRYFPDFGLFGVKDSIKNINLETQIFGSPRFLLRSLENGRIEKCDPGDNRSLLLIDLNAQMCDYYQNMGIFSLIINNEENSIDYFHKAELLQDHARSLLWDSNHHFFFDFDTENEQIQPLETSAGLWAMFGGLATKEKVYKICQLLKDPNHFWTELPVPHISLSEKKLKSNPWYNCVSLQDVLWIIIGLKRFNMNRLAVKLTHKCLNYLKTSYEIYHRIYSYYPADGINPHQIKQNQLFSSSINTISSKYPIHSLFYRGLLGSEILENNLNFVLSDYLHKEISFSLNYRGNLKKGHLSKFNQQISHIYP